MGTASGPEHSLLAGVVGAVRFPDGRIAIGDAGNARVTFFSSQGAFLRAAGRAGDGPGEYRLPRWIGRCSSGDVAVYDGAHNSVSFLTATGQFLRAMPLPPMVNFDLPIWCSGRNEVVMLFNQFRERVQPGQYLTVPTAVVRISGPAAIDTIDSGGVQEYYVAKSIGAGSEVPLGRATLVAAGRSLLFVASNVDGQVRVLDTAGRRKGTFTLDLSRSSVMQRDWARAIEARIEDEPLERTRKLLSVVLGELPQAKTFPRVDRIQADAADNLWVRTFDNYGTRLATWVIVSSTGQPLAVAVSPRSLRVLEIGRDYLLGVSADSDGVERVLVYRFSPVVGR